MEKKPKINDVDIKILKALVADARTSFAEIAKECNVTTAAISKRYKQMKKNGIITGSVLIMEHNSDVHAISVDIKVESNRENSVIETIKKIPRCRACFHVIGKYDIHAGIRVNSLQQIASIKKALESIQGVLHFDMTISIDTLFYFPENLSLFNGGCFE